MNELIFGSSVAKEAYQIKKLLKEKKIRKICARLYSSNLAEEPSAIVRRNLFKIISVLYPGAIISHRSALEIKPTSTNRIFITHSYTKKIVLPGIIIQFLRGKGPDEDDIKILGNLYASSKERAYLENLQLTKKTGADSKVLGAAYITERLTKILLSQGKIELENIRERAKRISEYLEMRREFELLDKIINELILSKDE